MTELSDLAPEPATAEPPWPKPAYAWYVVFVLLAAYTLSFVDRVILSLLIAPIRAALKISDTQVSLLVGLAFAIFYTVLGIPLGWIADRRNRRWLATCGIAVWSVMTAACGLASSFPALFLARIGVGAGEAALSPAAYSLLSDYFPREKLGRAIAVYSIGAPLGSGIALVFGAIVIKLVLAAPPVSLPLVGMLEAWRFTFFWVAAPGLLVALLMLSVREPFRRGRGQARVEAEPGFGRFLIRNAAAVGLHLTGMTLQVIFIYGLLAWAPTFLARTYGMSVTQAGLGFGAVMAISGGGGVLAGGWLADRLFRRGFKDAHVRTMRLAALLGGPLLFAMPFAPSGAWALALMTPGLLLLAMNGIAGAGLQLLAPNAYRARMAAVYLFVASSLGLGLGPTAMALGTDYLFHDDAALRYSIALVAAVVMPLSVLSLSLALKPFARSVVRAETA